MNWLKFAFQLRGSIVPKVTPKAIGFGLIGLFISILNYLQIPISATIIAGVTNNIVFNFILGLLLVFRTNTAYDRFWEGRKSWGGIIVNIRNLGRQIKTAVHTLDAQEIERKNQALKWLTAIAIATKLHLRQEPANQALMALVNETEFAQLTTAKNMPLAVIFWVSQYLEEQHQKKSLSGEQLINMNRHLDQIIESITSCERIASTPIPLAYLIFLRLLLLIYCFVIPFQVVQTASFYTVLVVTIISFVLLGVEAIAAEIENPFGVDPNDLPVDEFCQKIDSYIADLIAKN